MVEIENSLNASTTSNNQYYTSSTALQIRLDTTMLMENIELFLRGAKIVVEQDEATGKITTKRVSLGEAKANDRGIQSILNWMQLMLNPQVVQGNFPTDNSGQSSMYEQYIYYARIDLSESLIVNCYNWEILDEDIDVIIDSIMNAIEPFMTRLIGNKERESYDATIKHLESNTIQEGGNQGFKLWN